MPRFLYSKTRRFGGKVFKFQGSTETKPQANRTAKLLRESGRRVRVVKHYDVYLIYAR